MQFCFYVMLLYTQILHRYFAADDKTLNPSFLQVFTTQLMTRYFSHTTGFDLLGTYECTRSPPFLCKHLNHQQSQRELTTVVFRLTNEQEACKEVICLAGHYGPNGSSALFVLIKGKANMSSMKLVIPLHSLYWSIHTKDESKRGTAFAFIFGVN